MYLSTARLWLLRLALDSTGQAANDLLLENGEADQRGDHRQRGEGQYLSGIDRMLGAEHLHAERQGVLAGIVEQEQRQHVGVPAAHEAQDADGGHAGPAQRQHHTAEEADARTAVQLCRFFQFLRNGLEEWHQDDDGLWQAECYLGQNNAQMRVDQVQIAQQQIQRGDGHGDGGTSCRRRTASTAVC